MQARLKKLNQFLNPFESVRYDSEFAPDSRTMHTTFWQKLKDTFNVFKGGTNLIDLKEVGEGEKKKIQLTAAPFKLESSPGIFDYMTLGIGRGLHFLNTIIRKVGEDLKSKKEAATDAKKFGYGLLSVLNSIPKIIVGVLDLAVNAIARNVASFALTVAVSPLVAMAHGIAKAVANHKANKIPSNEIAVYEVVKQAAVELTETQGEKEAVSIQYNNTDQMLNKTLNKTPIRKMEVTSIGKEKIVVDGKEADVSVVTFKAPSIKDKTFAAMFKDNAAVEKLAELNPKARQHYLKEESKTSYRR